MNAYLGTLARLGLLSTLLCLGLPAGALAQDWPAKPIRIVINFPPGGPSEIVMRLAGERLLPALGQPLVIENKPGASGNIGADAVAKSAADGYTFGITPDTLYTVNPLVFRQMNLNPWTDLAPVILVGSFSQMMVCNPSVPVKTLGDLIELAKQSKLAYASGGAGVPGHLASELLLSMTGVSMLHVPYKGPAPATTDVVAARCPAGSSRRRPCCRTSRPASCAPLRYRRGRVRRWRRTCRPPRRPAWPGSTRRSTLSCSRRKARPRRSSSA